MLSEIELLSILLCMYILPGKVAKRRLAKNVEMEKKSRIELRSNYIYD